MTSYPNLNNEPEKLKIKTRDDESKNLKYQTEKHDHENILKTLKIDNEYYENKYKNLNRKKVWLIVKENFNRIGINNKYFYNVINQSQHRYSIK